MILRKLLMLVFLAVVVCAMGVGVSAAAVITVDDSGGADFTSIQVAVDAASEGDTIEVRSGMYVENVDVVKRLTLRGEGADVVTVTAASSLDHVFEVTANYVNISGFNATGASNVRMAGICLDSADHCNISENTASSSWNGICILSLSNYNTFTGNNCSNNYDGICLGGSSNNTLTGNIASDNERYGIFLYSSSNYNTIAGNNCSNNYDGIQFWYSSNNMLRGNTASSNNDDGIYLGGSSNNTLMSNTASNNYYGIKLDDSSDNTLANNTMSENMYNFEVLYDFHEFGFNLSECTQNIDTSNTVDGKPIYYWVDQKDRQIPSDAGFVGVVNGTNITVKDQTLTNNGRGVLFAYTENSRIENITTSNNYIGIYLFKSSNNTLASNTVNSNGQGILLDSSSNNMLTSNNCSNNYIGIGLDDYSGKNTLANNTANSNNYSGIFLSYSTDNTLTSNTANTNDIHGIFLDYSTDNTLTSNNCSNNRGGILLLVSKNNTLANNTANSNNHSGIVLADYSNNNTLVNNTASNNYYGIKLDEYSSNNMFMNNTASSNYYGIYLCDFFCKYNTFMNNTANSNNFSGIYMWDSSNNTLANNTANSNVRYGISLLFTSNSTIISNTANSNGDYGIYVELAGGSNMLANNTANLNNHGICLSSLSDSTITSNIANSNNFSGINLYDSSNCTLTSNIANSNGDCGIRLEDSNNNLIYNNYFNNTNNTYDDGNNQWDSGSVGNYYSDYTGTDSDGDGIGDTPYPIPGGSSVDQYPLMVPYTPPTSDYESKLIQQIGDFKVYLIEDGKKRHFTSPEALEWNGHSFDDVIEVSVDVINLFESGADISINQAIIDKYNALGGAATFGPPAGTGEQTGYPDNAGVICTYVNFQNGAIEYFTNGDQVGNTYAILNPFFDKWASMGYAKSVLGYPISDMSDTQTSSLGTPFKYQNFMNGTERGALEYNLSSGEVFEIHGAIYATWSAMDYANSILGLVTSDERDAALSFKGTTGRVSDFENGHLHWHSSGDHYMVTYMTYGNLDELYVSMGGTASWLGFPVMVQEDRGGYGYCEFEGGYIEWDGSVYKAIPITGPVHNINKGTNYTTIQAAIDDASPGDEIHVDSGTYYENVDVYKQLTLFGAGADVVTVQAADVGDHVFEVTADYVSISGFTVTGTTTSGMAGIRLSSANHCNISNNNASNNHQGISLNSASNNTLRNNTANSNSVIGIYLWGSINNTLRDNTMSGNMHNFGVSVYPLNLSNLSSYIQNIDTSNTVDGKPVYYWVDQQDKQIIGGAGFVAVVNSNNITVKDLTLRNNTQGVLFACTENSRIENVSASDNSHGICLYSSSNNTLANNNASNNVGGICLWSSSNCNTLTENNCSNNSRGIYLQNSSENMLTGNTALDNYLYGIWLDSSSNNTLQSSIASNNGGLGICIRYYSNNNTLKNNIVSGNVNGIWMWSSDGNILSSNTANLNYIGIDLTSTSNNTLTNNTASDNDYGICLYSPSSNNTLYHNTFINNTDVNAYDYSSTNQWDSGSEGNYWSDYTGTDTNLDGIGDTPYPIPGGSSVDRYPLMNPWTAAPLSGKIAFASSRDGNQEVYVMNANGSGDSINLTNHPDADDGDPTWSPDGTQIAFSSNRSGNWTTYIMNADGSNQVCLLEGVYDAWGPAWSPDGMKIAVAIKINPSDDFEIYTVDIQSKALTQVTDNTSTDCHPSWSPDSHKIVFTSDRDGNQEIYVADLLANTQTKLTDEPEYDDYPEWSPDGTMIAFVSERDGNLEIYSMDIASKAINRLTYSESIDKHAQWSPDGQEIVFISDRDGGDMDVYVMKADGTSTTCLVEWDGDETHPTWSSGHSSPPAYSVGEGAPDSTIKQHFIDAYNRNGGVSVLGDPATEVHDAWGYLVQDFPGVSGIPGGVIMYNDIKDDAFYIHGAIWERYYIFVDKYELGPVADDERDAAPSRQGTTGRYSKFENGTIHWISDDNADHPNKGESFVTYGNLDAIYTSWGGTDGNLGFPTIDQLERDEHSYCEFEGGYIRWNDLTENYKKHLVDVDIISPENLDPFEEKETIHLRGQILSVGPFEYEWLIYEVGQPEDSGKRYSGVSDTSLMDTIDTSIEKTGKYNIKFCATDSNGYSCEKELQIQIFHDKETYDTSFRPNVQGYQFENYVSDPYSWDMFKNTFGRDQVEFENGQKRNKTVSFYESKYKNLSENSGGSCFGMSANSLALYSQEYNGSELAAKSSIFNPGEKRDLDKADIFPIWGSSTLPVPPIMDYNLNGEWDDAPRKWKWDSNKPRPWDTNDESVFPLFMNTPRDWVDYYHGLQLTSGCKADMSFYDGVNKVYKELKYRIDSNYWKQNSMVLGVVWLDNGKEVGHAVVPYKITENETSKVGTIFIYDSSSPNLQEDSVSLGPRIEINLNDMTANYIWIYDGWPIDGGLSAGNEYEYKLTTLQAVSFDSIQSKPELPENARDITSNGHLGFTDSSGRHLGYHEGEFKDEIPGGNRIVPFGQIEYDQFLEEYYLPDVNLKQELYGIQEGIATASMYTPNGLIVADVCVSPTSVDEFRVPFDGSSIEFISGNGTSSLSLMLDKETAYFAQIVRINVSGIESNGAINLSNIEGTILINNSGLPRTCNLYLEQMGISPNSDDSIKDIVIEENSTILITPLNWNDISNSNVIIEHDLKNDGIVDYTETLQLTDTTPPSTVMDFQSTVGSSWINWRWTNPYNTDFSHAIIYVDGEFEINTSDASYNLTGLQLETEHTISILTADVNENMNLNWFNDTSVTRREINLEDISFTINRTLIFSGDMVEFNASSIYDPDGTILNYFWHFGDNTTNSTATGVLVNHMYGEVGFYNVTFLVMDEDWNEKNIIIKQILVNKTNAIPPSTITNLKSNSGTRYLNFTWTNPPDPDFNHTELYLNGTFLTNIPAPQNYYNITGLLPDTSYELSTRTVDTSGNINLTWVNDTASTLPASGIALNLYTGWNLISLPLMPEDTSITSLLSPINGNYSIVWEYNASDTSNHWKKYDPGAPFGNDLVNMEPGKGYWIMMISDDTLPISGTVPESTDINLTIGWNLIGYNSLDGQPVAEALSSISGNYTIVWAYDASDTADHWKKYDPGAPFGNDLADMEPGRGYWIMMTTDDILEIE